MNILHDSQDVRVVIQETLNFHKMLFGINLFKTLWSNFNLPKETRSTTR